MKKLFKIYLSAIKNSFNAICRSWLIIPFSAILLFVSNIILSLLVRIGPNGGFSVGGFLAGMFTIFAMSIFYHFLSIAASSQKLRFSDIKDVNFSLFSPLSKFVLMFDMLAGRLELFPLLILFHPSVWRDKN